MAPTSHLVKVSLPNILFPLSRLFYNTTAIFVWIYFSYKSCTSAESHTWGLNHFQTMTEGPKYVIHVVMTLHPDVIKNQDPTLPLVKNIIFFI